MYYASVKISMYTRIYIYIYVRNRVGPGKKITTPGEKFKGFTPTNPWKKKINTLEKKFKQST